MAKGKGRKFLAVLLTFAMAVGLMPAISIVADTAAGDIWTDRTDANPTATGGNSLRAVCYGGSAYAAVGDNGTIVTSADGIAWTSRVSGYAGILQGVSYGNGIFVAVGTPSANGEGVVLTSSDNGVTWTSQTISGTYSVARVCYGGGIFMAFFDGDCYTSADGSAWIYKSLIENYPVYGLGYGNIAGTETYVVVGYALYYSNPEFECSYQILISTDYGASWSTDDSIENATIDNLFAACYGGGGFAAVGGSGAVLTSHTGQTGTWTPQLSLFGDLYGVCYGDGRYIAVGYDSFNAAGLVYSSTDGIDWSPEASNTANNLQGVCYGDNAFVAIGENGAIITCSWVAAPAVTSAASITNDATPTWTWTARGGGNGIYRYKMDDGDLTSDAAETTAASYTPGSELGEGSHTLYVQESDAADNWSASGSCTVTVDTAAPSAPSMPDLAAGSDTGVSGTDNVTNDTTPTFTGTMESGSTVFLYDSDGTTVLGTAEADAGGNWSITSSTLASGSHTVTARASDAAGNISEASAYLSIAMDTTAPTAAISMGDTALTAGESTTVTFAFSEAVTGFANGCLTVPNGVLTAVTSADGGVTYSAAFTADGVDDDTNTIDADLAVITDLAGNAGSGTAVSANYTITSRLAAPGAPTDVTATAGDGRATVSFTAPASDGGTAITGYTVTASPGGITATGASSPITVTGLTNGTEYTFTVKATNAAGTGADSVPSGSVIPAPSGGDPAPTGGMSSAPAQTYYADVKAGDGSSARLPVEIDGKTGSASVDAGSLSGLISDGKTAVITIPAIPDTDAYSVCIPTSELSTADTRGDLTIETDKGSITVPSNMLTGAMGAGGDGAQITIGEGDRSVLPDGVKEAMDDRPLIRLTLSIDGRQIDRSNPEAPVTLSIPYTPTAAELEHLESIIVRYIDGSGNVVSVPNGRCDAAAGAVLVNVTRFGDYAVVYNPVNFDDVEKDAWFADAVSFIAARGITDGMGGGRYSPDAKLTRGEFIVMMMRACGIAPDEHPSGNFADAGDTYYTGCLAAAKRLGITDGMGNNFYMPERPITRQEMFTLLYNALKVIEQLPGGGTPKTASPTLSDFTDAGQIDSWALEAMTRLVETGTVTGSGDLLTPLDTTTRAQMAQMLYNLLSK